MINFNKIVPNTGMSNYETRSRVRRRNCTKWDLPKFTWFLAICLFKLKLISNITLHASLVLCYRGASGVCENNLYVLVNIGIYVPSSCVNLRDHSEHCGRQEIYEIVQPL